MIPVSELLGSAIRHAVCAKEGHVLVAADLGSIESRVLGWVTNCQRINRVFAEDLDTYKDFACTYFGIPYDQVTKAQRNFSKPPVLGAGYGLGWRGMIAYAEGYGVALDEEKAKRVVEVFRSSYHEIPTFWQWIDAAVKHTVTTGKTVFGYRLMVHLNRDFLCIKLPSGRDLWYFRPDIQLHKTPWGEMKPTFSYMGLDDRNQWVRLYAHPGLVTENCLAGDTEILTDSGWKRLDAYTPGDLLWDGESWVYGGVLLDRGVQTVIGYEGVNLTPDHLILSNRGWSPAETLIDETFGISRANVQLPDGYQEEQAPKRKRGRILGLLLRMWRGDRSNWVRSTQSRESRKESVLWEILPSPRKQKTKVAWDVLSPGILGMEIYARPLSVTYASGISQLRGERDQSVQKMGFLRSFLERHGTLVSTRAKPRTHEQQQRVLPFKLPMAHSEKKRQQQKEFSSPKYSNGTDDSSPSVQKVQDKRNHFTLPFRPSVARRPATDSPRPHQQRVYDITNVGPLKRFTVRGGPGHPPFVVHNCIQAIARDFLAYGMTLADQRGLSIVLHVHDEIVCEEPEFYSEYYKDQLICCMTTNPPWAPDIKLGAGGYTAKRYRKD